MAGFTRRSAKKNRLCNSRNRSQAARMFQVGLRLRRAVFLCENLRGLCVKNSSQGAAMLGDSTTALQRCKGEMVVRPLTKK